MCSNAIPDQLIQLLSISQKHGERGGILKVIDFSECLQSGVVKCSKQCGAPTIGIFHGYIKWFKGSIEQAGGASVIGCPKPASTRLWIFREVNRTDFIVELSNLRNRPVSLFTSSLSSGFGCGPALR